MAPTTRPSLLLRLKDHTDHEAWREFHSLYAPLLYSYARARGLGHHDAEEIRDQCLEVVASKIQSFEYDAQRGGFKRWLGTMADRRVIDLLRRRRETPAESGVLRGLADPSPGPAEDWDAAWRRHLLRHCLDQVGESVPEISYRAFCMLLFEQRSADEVAERLGLQRTQVYKAKFHVLQKVRRKMSELDDE